MDRTGVVKAVQGEWLEIEFCRPADCEKCNACHGGDKVMSLRLKGKASVGDKAVVSLPASVVTCASLIVYAIPLAALLLGMVAGEQLIPLKSPLGMIIGGGVGIALAAAGLMLTEKRRQADPRWQPQLVRVIPAEPNDD